MNISKKTAVFILFFAAQFCTSEYAYLRTYPGVSVQDADEKEFYIFHNEKVKILSQDREQGKYREETSGKKFILPKKYFNSSENTLYYSVDTRAGLFLRKEPSRESGKILLMPYKSSGKIVGIQKEFSVIDRIRSPWVQVQYRDSVGWAFAGYLRVFQEEKELKEYLKQDDSFIVQDFLSADKMSSSEFNDLISKYKYKKVYENPDWEILDFRFLYEKDKECHIAKWNQLVYKNRNSGEIFTVRDRNSIHLKSERIVQSDFPFTGIVTAESVCCWCCCPCNNTFTYFLAKDRPYFVKWNIVESNGKAECGGGNENDPFYMNFETELRTADAGTVYARIKGPPCRFDGSFSQSTPNDLHLLVRFQDGKFSYERKVTLKDQIPEEFKELFEKTVKLKSPSRKQINWYKVLEEYNGVKY